MQLPSDRVFSPCGEGGGGLHYGTQQTETELGRVGRGLKPILGSGGWGLGALCAMLSAGWGGCVGVWGGGGIMCHAISRLGCVGGGLCAMLSAGWGVCVCGGGGGGHYVPCYPQVGVCKCVCGVGGHNVPCYQQVGGCGGWSGGGGGA